MGQAARLPVDLFHVVLVDPQDLARNGLDVAEFAGEPRRVRLSPVKRVPLLAGAFEEVFSLTAIMVAQRCQCVNQLSFPGHGDIVLLLGEGGVVQSAVCLKLPVRLLFSPGQRKPE